jgi:hypothetical protein
LGQKGNKNQPRDTQRREGPRTLLPPGKEQSCWNSKQDCYEKDQDLSRSCTTAIWCARAQDEEDQCQKSESYLYMLAIDFLGEEEEIRELSFHVSPFLSLICQYYTFR